MFLFLSKLLPLFVYPVGLTCIFLAVTLILPRRTSLQTTGLILALAVLLLFSNRWVARGLARSLEWQYLPGADLPKTEVIVLLGGGTRSAQYPRPIVELNEAGDRMLYAAWLYRQSKAPHILVSGGSIDWLGSQTPEAENMRDVLEIMGVPHGAIWLESTSRNTYENAVNVKAILAPKEIKRILLVTSAMHMPRSVAIFRHQGFEVIPAPVDYQVTQGDGPGATPARLGAQLLYLLPSSEYLDLSTRAIKEYIGLVVYRLRGWL